MELKIEKTTAKRLFSETPEWFQKVLIETFGKECFKKKNYDSIETFEDACNELGIASNDVFTEKDSPDEVAYKKLKVIVKAINQGWIPNWDDLNQRKWFPWFKMSSGFGFGDSSYACDYMYTYCGSRLCFESEEKANYAGTQFIALYKALLTITK
ncbi:MAG: hypothetical protein PHW73_01155 [Atribacterota bacterium]|nr:hypothetical protein [Atribacterota bacterium]